MESSASVKLFGVSSTVFPVATQPGTSREQAEQLFSPRSTTTEQRFIFP
jgi:hypothetical protein